MSTSYARILSYPGSGSFSAAGLVARFPISMVGVSTVLAVQGAYGSYTAAGVVSAANVVALALGAPLLARLVDAHGQSRVMAPALCGSALALLGLVGATSVLAPLPVLLLLSAAAGGLTGSMGSLVRARWTALLRTPREVHTAFSLEAALDEVAFIVGPVLATALCTAPGLPATSGWLAALVMQVGGGAWFLSQRATEPAARDGSRRAPGAAGTAEGTRSTSTSAAPGDGPAEGPGAGAGALAPPPVLRYGAVLATTVVFLFSGAMFGANDVTAVAFATEQGHQAASGLLLAAWSLGSLTSALVYGARPWGWPLWLQLLTGVTVLALGASTFVLAPGLVVLGTLMALTGTAIAPTIISGNNTIQATVAPSQLTEGLAWVSTALNIGVSLGSLLVGGVIDAAGSHGGYLVVAAFAWAAVAAALAGSPVLRRARTSRRLGTEEQSGQ